MSDIVQRLRRWSISTDAVPASDIMDEAADEIERLRLTDAEREAVTWFACYGVDRPLGHSTTLRCLLERMG